MNIQGKYNTAVCYAKVIEPEAVEQIRRMCDYEFTENCTMRIMPDVHAGKGCTIGTTMTIRDKAVPNVVGVDIGCGMYTVALAERDLDFESIDAAAHFVPSGPRVWEGRQEHFDLTALKCHRALRDSKRIERSLGTLGGGNHFIEVDRGADGTNYLVIHTGSRSLGKQVADYYQTLAEELHEGKEDYLRRRDALIAEYKAAGRRSEIQDALKLLTWNRHSCSIPNDLRYLYGKYLADYLHDVVICQNFARRNRELIAEVILQRTGLTAADSFHTVHNYIATDEMILRKGAIAAHKGERVLIPINMRDGAILATGKGNLDWNFSAPHGAGRLMSRTAARETLALEDYQKQMQGIYTTSVNDQTLDESPMAYKSLSDILDVIGPTVDVIEVLKPVYNFKAN